MLLENFDGVRPRAAVAAVAMVVLGLLSGARQSIAANNWAGVWISRTVETSSLAEGTCLMLRLKEDRLELRPATSDLYVGDEIRTTRRWLVGGPEPCSLVPEEKTYTDSTRWRREVSAREAGEPGRIKLTSFFGDCKGAECRETTLGLERIEVTRIADGLSLSGGPASEARLLRNGAEMEEIAGEMLPAARAFAAALAPIPCEAYFDSGSRSVRRGRNREGFVNECRQSYEKLGPLRSRTCVEAATVLMHDTGRTTYGVLLVSSLVFADGKSIYETMLVVPSSGVWLIAKLFGM